VKLGVKGGGTGGGKARCVIPLIINNRKKWDIKVEGGEKRAKNPLVHLTWGMGGGKGWQDKGKKQYNK